MGKNKKEVLEWVKANWGYTDKKIIEEWLDTAVNSFLTFKNTLDMNGKELPTPQKLFWEAYPKEMKENEELRKMAMKHWHLSPGARDLFILQCSKKKIATKGKAKAINIYNGPTYQMIRKLIREGRCRSDIDILILSAKYGLISKDQKIKRYNMRMTPRRTKAIRADVLNTVEADLFLGEYNHLYINTGKDYKPALRGVEGVARKRGVRVRWIEGRIGERNKELKKLLSIIKEETTSLKELNLNDRLYKSWVSGGHIDRSGEMTVDKSLLAPVLDGIASVNLNSLGFDSPVHITIHLKTNKLSITKEEIEKLEAAFPSCVFLFNSPLISLSNNNNDKGHIKISISLKYDAQYGVSKKSIYVRRIRFKPKEDEKELVESLKKLPAIDIDEEGDRITILKELPIETVMGPSFIIADIKIIAKHFSITNYTIIYKEDIGFYIKHLQHKGERIK